MLTIDSAAGFLDSFAPAELAEAWDNVGLLVGDRSRPLRRIMTCLTITPDSTAEAVDEQVDLIVAHHPLPFRPLLRLTTDGVDGRLLWQLIRAGVSVYSPHTAFDSAAGGINQRLAEGLGLREIEPMVTKPAGSASGRWGRLEQPLPLEGFADRVKQFLKLDGLRLVGASGHQLTRVAVACGSAGEMLSPARDLGCDCLVTGETRFHTCLEAEASGVALLLAGHYASERFAVEFLAELLAGQFNAAEVWASRRERDPLRWG